jgi:hypothetical protein
MFSVISEDAETVKELVLCVRRINVKLIAEHLIMS